MPRRLLLALVVTIATTSGVTTPAAAHEPEQFTACAAPARHSPQCYRHSATYEHGRTVFLRGRVTPAHPGFGQVWRRLPQGGPFVRVGTIGVAEDGHLRWSWRPTRVDVAPEAPYTFYFRIPGHGTSTRTEVWVVHPHSA